MKLNHNDPAIQHAFDTELALERAGQPTNKPEPVSPAPTEAEHEYLIGMMLARERCPEDADERRARFEAMQGAEPRTYSVDDALKCLAAIEADLSALVHAELQTRDSAGDEQLSDVPSRS